MSTGWASATVPPGSETGHYYIPVGNLPFLVHWQDLKDWLREVCEVDRVEVCGPTKGSGWIRVRGQKNFRRALQRLNNDAFNNRALIAQDLNRNKAIPIYFPETSDGPQIPPEVENYNLSPLPPKARMAQQHNSLHAITTNPNPYPGPVSAVAALFSPTNTPTPVNPPYGYPPSISVNSPQATPTAIQHSVYELAMLAAPRVNPFDMSDIVMQTNSHSIELTPTVGSLSTNMGLHSSIPPAIGYYAQEDDTILDEMANDAKGTKRTETMQPMVVCGDSRKVRLMRSFGGCGFGEDLDGANHSSHKLPELSPHTLGEPSGSLYDGTSPSSSMSSLPPGSLYDRMMSVAGTSPSSSTSSLPPSLGRKMGGGKGTQ